VSLERFRDCNFRQSTLELIEKCSDVVTDYSEQGYRLTLRQLYYQLVTQNIIENTEKQYKRLGSILTSARYAGMIDWDAIEDRGRQPKVQTQFDNVPDLVEGACHSYRLPRWEGQEHYVELWVEKEALAGVLQPIARKYHITMMVNKGYSSASAMKASAERFASVWHWEERPGTLLYLGDLDPSGEDMVRDIDTRLTEFGIEELDVQKIALTIEQVREYEPPPNPTKLTDSRAPEYVRKYGLECWEVDALTPQVLNQVISDAVEDLLDMDLMDAVIAKEKKDIKRLRAAARRIK